MCPFLWRFRAGFWHAGRRAGVKVETSSVNPLVIDDLEITWLPGCVGSGRRRGDAARARLRLAAWTAW